MPRPYTYTFYPHEYDPSHIKDVPIHSDNLYGPVSRILEDLPRQGNMVYHLVLCETFKAPLIFIPVVKRSTNIMTFCCSSCAVTMVLKFIGTQLKWKANFHLFCWGLIVQGLIRLVIETNMVL